MRRYFYCYNGRLKNYLLEKGFRYILVNKNTNSGSMFWMFERDKELTNAIDEYHANK